MVLSKLSTLTFVQLAMWEGTMESRLQWLDSNDFLTSAFLALLLKKMSYFIIGNAHIIFYPPFLHLPYLLFPTLETHTHLSPPLKRISTFPFPWNPYQLFPSLETPINLSPGLKYDTIPLLQSPWFWRGPLSIIKTPSVLLNFISHCVKFPWLLVVTS